MSEEIKVFTYKDEEEAKKYIGKDGYFSDILQDFENKDCEWSKLTFVEKGKPYPFCSEDNAYQFFQPGKPFKAPEYVPYTFEDAKEFRDLWIVYKNSMSKITCVTNDGVWLVSGHISYCQLLNYTKEDGTPFGKLKT